MEDIKSESKRSIFWDLHTTVPGVGTAGSE